MYINRIKSIPGLINSVENLYDLLLILFPDGLNYLFVDTKNIGSNTYTGHSFNPVQKLFMNIIRTLFPPTHDIYILNDSCSRNVEFDDEKNSLITETISIMREADNLYDYLNSINQKIDRDQELTNEEEENKCQNFERIQESRNILYNRMKVALDHYSNYREIIRTYNLEVLAKGRIQIVKRLYIEYLNVIKNNCGKK